MQPIKLNGMMIFSVGDMLVLKPTKRGTKFHLPMLSEMVKDNEEADLEMIERQVKQHRKKPKTKKNREKATDK